MDGTIVRDLKIMVDQILNICHRVAAKDEEIAALKAEIAELKTPDFFFNEDYDCGGGDMLAATHIMNLHQVCRISKMKKLSEHFVVNKYDQDEEEFNTQPEAEAFVASLKGEK